MGTHHTKTHMENRYSGGLENYCKSGEGGHRSRCLFDANEALYHLSYSPDLKIDFFHLRDCYMICNKVGRRVGYSSSCDFTYYCNRSLIGIG